MALLTENEQFHLKIKNGDVGRYAILPGDPGRVPLIAKYLDNAEFVASNREYTTYTGYLLGEKVSVDGKRCHVGVVHSKDSFYGEIEPLQMPVGDKLSGSWSAYVKCGCLTSEMESAAIFSVALARRKRAGAVFTALWNVERSNAGLPDTVCMDSDRAIRTAVNAVKILIEQDRKNGI